MNIVCDKTLFACVLVLTVFCGVVAFAQTDGANQSPAARTSIMSFEDYAKKRHRVPYVLKIRGGKGRLLYFGARHTF
jgi:hypothetical protein